MRTRILARARVSRTPSHSENSSVSRISTILNVSRRQHKHGAQTSSNTVANASRGAPHAQKGDPPPKHRMLINQSAADIASGATNPAAESDRKYPIGNKTDFGALAAQAAAGSYVRAADR